MALAKHASDEICGLVCGFAEPLRSHRLLMTLKAYIDDSGLSDPPVGVLAGWVASAEKWGKFSDDWQQALEMKPSLAYFKMSEARSFGGQFLGWSQQSRDERLRLLISIISACEPLGIAAAVPLETFQFIFHKNPDPIIRHPYFFLFHNIVVGLSRYLARQGSVMGKGA
jgi:hypothetical protein